MKIYLIIRKSTQFPDYHSSASYNKPDLKGAEEKTTMIIRILKFSKIQVVVYYQHCDLIGWATTRLYAMAF